MAKWQDDLPVIVGYCQGRTDSEANNWAECTVQSQKLMDACRQHYGKDSFHIIFIYDRGLGIWPYQKKRQNPDEYRSGLELLSTLVHDQRIHMVFVTELAKLSRDNNQLYSLLVDIFEPNQVQLAAITNGNVRLLKLHQKASRACSPTAT